MTRQPGRIRSSASGKTERTIVRSRCANVWIRHGKPAMKSSTATFSVGSVSLRGCATTRRSSPAYLPTNDEFEGIPKIVATGVDSRLGPFDVVTGGPRGAERAKQAEAWGLRRIEPSAAREGERDASDGPGPRRGRLGGGCPAQHRPAGQD